MYYFYRQVCNYRKWLKKLNWAQRGFFSHPLLCDLPSPPKCEFIVPSSRIFHLHHWVLPIKVGDNWKLYPHPTLLQVFSSPKSLLIPVFLRQKKPNTHTNAHFFQYKKGPQPKKRNTIKSPSNIFYFWKVGRISHQIFWWLFIAGGNNIAYENTRPRWELF